MKTSAITMLAAMILTAGATLTVLELSAAPGQAPVTDKLASSTYVVFAASPQVWRVKVDPQTMANVTISGHFAVTAGTPKNLDVLVFNEDNYMKWKGDNDAERAAAKPLASALRKTEGDISQKLTEPGYYFLVFSDRHEYEGKKTVVADFKLQYEKR